MFSKNQGTNENDSQSNPHPEAGLLTSGREDRHDMVTGVQKEIRNGHNRNITVRKRFERAALLIVQVGDII